MGLDLSVSSRNAEKRLWIALIVSTVIVIVEFTGGFLGQSLALISDSGHVLTDVLAVGVGILTLRLGRKRHTARRTFRSEEHTSELQSRENLVCRLLLEKKKKKKKNEQ